jgi:hypothetical protein
MDASNAYAVNRQDFGARAAYQERRPARLTVSDI